MIQDSEPEDLETEAVEPADDEGREHRTAWPWIVILILVLIIIWVICHCRGCSPANHGTSTTTGIPVTTGTHGPTGPSTTGSKPSKAQFGPTVPYVVGLARSAAIGAVSGAGYNASVTTVYGTTAPANTVIYQNPSGGTTYPLGNTVGLLVQLRSRGSATVPNLIGLSRAAASRKVRALGLKVVLSYFPVSKKPGVVHSQWPLPGHRRKLGDDVQLQITIVP